MATVLNLTTETEAERETRELADQKKNLESKLQAAYQRKNAQQEIVHRSARLESDHANEFRFLREQEENPTIPADEFQKRRDKNYERGLEKPQAKRAAEVAKSEIQAIETEIANIQNTLEQCERECWRRERIRLLRNLIEPAKAFVNAQQALTANTEAARSRGWTVPDIGVMIMPHPAATRTDRREHAVNDYLRFLLAQLDPAFAETLDKNDPARRMLEAAKRGAGISAPAVVWG